MNNLKIKVSPLNIPFTVSFKHASSEISKMASVIVKVERGDNFGLGEGCPRIYVTGETTDSAERWIKKNRELIETECISLTKLKTFVDEHSSEIDGNEAAWCAVETALLDLFGKEANMSIDSLLGIDERKKDFIYSAVVGNGSYETLITQYDFYTGTGFYDYKMKISGDIDEDLMKLDLFREKVFNVYPDKAQLRIDANNLWKEEDPEECLEYIKKLNFPFSGVEEPFNSRSPEKVDFLYRNLGIPMILDESMCRIGDIDLYSALSGEFAVNFKLSKVGGLLRGIEIVKKLKELNWDIMIGTHVGETSILTRLALSLARFSGDNLVAQEGAFGTFLIEYDVVGPVLMFGDDAKLSLDDYYKKPVPGLGILPNERLDSFIM